MVTIDIIVPKNIQMPLRSIKLLYTYGHQTRYTLHYHSVLYLLL